MSAKQVGRNNPCPCGSGKKYKQCCLRRDQRAGQEPGESAQVSGGELRLSDAARRAADQLVSRVGPGEREEWQRTLDLAGEMAAYEERRDAIEAASEQLEAHRAEFEELMGDYAAAMDHAHRLFSEERFEPLRYTVDDVHRAFEAVGYPRLYRQQPGPEDMDTLIAAMLSHVDERDRLYLSRRLMLLLPETVAAGRYVDAWMIQLSAFQMLDSPEQSNPFLTTMFFAAFEEWQEQLEAQRSDFLQKLNLDPEELVGITEDELDAHIGVQTWDQANAQAEAYYRQYPMLRDLVEADLYAMAQDAVTLLERDDARHLYLLQEEIKPWVAELMERQAEFIRQVRKDTTEGREPNAEIVQSMQGVMIDLVGEMVEAIFDSGRRKQMADDLAAYSRRLRSSGDHEAAMLAYAASAEVKSADPRVYFLVGVCHYSLLEGVRAAACREGE